ncbi:hypothetical protein DFH06DRAFT_1140018 [Mycena polygramma]|nr:hypothetical protein DFH06DRAFT_1140018 [Mycena polygramma]
MADTLPDDPMDDTPAEPGSRFNPVLLSDSPPKRKAKRRSILESRSRSAVMGESDALPTDVAMDDATPTAPGSRFNPYLLPDSPPKRKAKRILASRDTMAAVSTRIGELEAAIPIPVLNTTNLPSTSRASTSRASTSRASTSQASTSRASPSQSRPRHAILALEASLRENRTARTVAETRSAARLRTMGPATDIPRGDQDVRLDAARTLDAAHAGRREEAYLTRGVGMMIAVGSWRPQRATKLRPEDLWKNGVGPAEQDAIEDHHSVSDTLTTPSAASSFLDTMQRLGRHSYKNVVDLDQDDNCAASRVADLGVYFSVDGQTRTEEISNVRHKKRRVGPSDLKDPLAEWIPGRDDDFTEDAAREPERIVVNLESVLGKRKQYASTTDPMSLFRPMKAFFLDELLRHEGLGDDLQDPRRAAWRRISGHHCTLFGCVG